MKPGIVLRLVIIVVLFVLGAVFVQRGYSTETSRTATQGAACEMPFPLPNPSEIGVSKFDKLLHTFLEKGCYKVWVADSQIRNSGPLSGVNLSALTTR